VRMHCARQMIVFNASGCKVSRSSIVAEAETMNIVCHNL
jgi:hypothetical protein